MPDVLLVLTLVTALGAGVAAGVFFAFSNFVMKALGRVPSAEGIRAMQEINVTVINPGFMTALFGTGATCVAVIVTALADWEDSYGPYLLVSGVVYLVGCIAVTMVFNVPRNDTLAKLQPASADATGVWKRYLSEWTAWNTVRTIASLAAMATSIGGIAAA
jgi:uncharacterized membrane protein